MLLPIRERSDTTGLNQGSDNGAVKNDIERIACAGTSDTNSTNVIGDARSRGVVRVRLPLTTEECAKWAEELSKPTLFGMMGEGDGQYAFYRNILDEPDFPFERIVPLGSDGADAHGLSAVAACILEHFDVDSLDDLRLDDAFCVHYNTDQDDTSGAKHKDPSDITVNMCLEATDDMQGSHVKFYGSKVLKSHKEEHDHTNGAVRNEAFFVPQRAGFATVHYGDHPHETMPLFQGRRTNIVMTYCYKDSSRSDVAIRSCYA